VFAQGPMPIDEAIGRCAEILAQAPDDRAIELAMSYPLAHAYARLGDFELARALAARCQEIATQNGQAGVAANSTEITWDVETLAGNHDVAERVIAEGRDRLVELGDDPAIHEAFLARSQVALGRDIDIARLAAIAGDQIGWPQALLRAALAAALSQQGHLAAAEREARSALDFLASSDYLTTRADAMLILGDILRSGGRSDEADASFRVALDLYRQRGSLVDERTAMARLFGQPSVETSD